MNELNQDKDCECEKGCTINIHCSSKNPHPQPPHHHEEPEFAEVYSLLPQTLAASPGTNMPGDLIAFENTVYSTANIDTSLAASQGKITVKKAGWYDVATGICAFLNPIPSPLPVFTVSLFLNGAIVPGSTLANVPLSPTQQSNETVADVFVYLNAGDVLTLANTSTAQIFLAAPSLGTNAQPASAYMKIQLLRAGAK